ncbi:MAG TPA: hypothetical protein VMB21_00395 [Candidatus Limnocylindria bacterium]|jgi:hypothetical protein|nr:hypothetical protein [Candidatus Limnocylindria bacterium]
MADFILEWFPEVFALGVFVVFGWVIVSGTLHHARERRARAKKLSRAPGCFVFAKIMDPIGPMARSEKYAEALERDLEAEGLGMVTGGGTQMRKDGSVEWVGIDLDLTDLDRGIEFTRRRLRELGAPRGSVLEYSLGEQRVTVEIV